MAYRRKSLVQAGNRIAAFGAGIGIAAVGGMDASRLVVDIGLAVMGMGMLIPLYAIWRFRGPRVAVRTPEEAVAVCMMFHYVALDDAIRAGRCVDALPERHLALERVAANTRAGNASTRCPLSSISNGWQVLHARLCRRRGTRSGRGVERPAWRPGINEFARRKS